ncbi:MAG TPA: DMT family transporter [Candidatus Acidoferrales bacterium]
MDIILGISAALGWGVADFSARFPSRRIGAYRTLMIMQFFGFLALTIYLWQAGVFSRGMAPGWRPWFFASIAGVLNTVSGLALYRSFEVGAMSIAGPVSSAYPALTVVLALLSGERIHALRATGLAVTLVGVIFAALSFASDKPAAGSGSDHVSEAHLSKGAALAILAATGYGVMFWWLGFHVVPLVGSAVSVWVVRITTLSVLLLVGIPTGKAVPLPRGNIWWFLLAVGLMDTFAFVANNAGLSTGHVAVVSVLASLYGAVTVLLSWIFLRERIERTQWFGIFLIFVGVVLVSL